MNIVKSFSSQNENSCQFVLDQLPVKISRDLETYVKKCLKENEKKEKRKKADALRRERKKIAKMMALRHTEVIGGGADLSDQAK